MKSIMIPMTASLLIFSGCSSMVTHDLDSSKPVEIVDSFFDYPLKQNGQTVDYFDASKKFSQIPEAQSAVTASRVYFWTSLVTAGASGWFLGTAIGESQNNGRDGGIGIGFLAVTSILSHFQKTNLIEEAKS